MLKWLQQSKPHEWVNTTAGVVSALAAAATFAYSYIVIAPDSKNAEKQANRAIKNVNDLNVSRSTVESQNFSFESIVPKPPTNPSSTPIKLPFVLQMASYQVKNCKIAIEEIKQYKDEFTSNPQLFLTADKRYVVIGLEFQERTTAEAAQNIAQNLASKYPNESLDQTRIRTQPNWVPYTCP